ncbi:MAG: OsmC family protein [Myxococcaceae bacterium]
MMTPNFVEVTADAEGGLQTHLTHLPSGKELGTDAPKDNGGNGGSFSPTDLVASGLLACMLTTMALAAIREGIAWGPTRGRVEKHMNPSPRRIGLVVVELWLPPGLTSEHRTRMQHVAESCPVHRSLHPDVQVSVRYH